MGYKTIIPQMPQEEQDTGLDFLGIAKSLLPIALGAVAGPAGMAGSGLLQFLDKGGVLNEFNGPLHEQGGIQLQGGRANVEGEEVSYKVGESQLIFSNSIKLPGTNKTPAQLAKIVDKRYSRRPDDAYSRRGKDEALKKIFTQQEEYKASQQSQTMAENNSGTEPPQQQMFDVGGAMLPEVAKMLNQNKTAIGLGTVAQLLTTAPTFFRGKPDKVNLGRVTPETINLESQRTSLRNEQAGYLASAKRKSGRLNNAESAISSYLSADAASPYRKLISESTLNENLKNAELKTRASEINQQTRIQEEDINAQNLGAHYSAKDAALAKVGAGVAGGVSDWTAANSSANMMDFSKKYYNNLMGDDTIPIEEKKKLLEEINRKVNPSEIFNYPSIDYTNYGKFGGILKSKRIRRK